MDSRIRKEDVKMNVSLLHFCMFLSRGFARFLNVRRKPRDCHMTTSPLAKVQVVETIKKRGNTFSPSSLNAKLRTLLALPRVTEVACV